MCPSGARSSACFGEFVEFSGVPGWRISRVENNPWETAFPEDLDLPSGVRGPVEAVRFYGWLRFALLLPWLESMLTG